MKKKLKDKKIAFDFDGVIANTNKEKIEWLRSKGYSIKCADKTSFYSELSQNLANSQIEKLYNNMSKIIFQPETLDKTKPILGAIKTIKRLSHKFNIYIITARTEELIKPIYDWLKKYNLSENIQDIISSSYESKQDICLKNNICFLCDDDVRHLVNKKVKRRVLFNTDKRKLKDDIIVAESWDEIERILTELN